MADERDPQFFNWIELALRGELDETTQHKLQSALQADAELRQEFQDYVAIHAELHWLARFHGSDFGSTLPGSADAISSSNRYCLDETTERPSQPVTKPLPGSLDWGQSPVSRTISPLVSFGFGVLLAGLLAGSVWWFVRQQADAWKPERPIATADGTGSGAVKASNGDTTQRTQGESIGADEAIASQQPGVVEQATGGEFTGPELARITGTRNSRWAPTPGSSEFGYDSPLFAGQRLHLTAGLAEVTFASGARVILEAPAELDVAAFNESVLHRGRMTALVPDGAEGFKVNMSGVTIVDRGTEFGLSADDRGQVEVHVFDGLVEGHFDEAWGPTQRLVEWSTNTAVTIDSVNRTILPVTETESSFIRSLDSSSTPGNGILAKEDFEYPGAPLADQNGGFGWGGAWSVLSAEGDAGKTNRIFEGSLKYSGLINSGNRVVLDGNFNRVRRVLSTSLGGVFDVAGMVEDQDGARLIGRDGTTLYLSFTQKVGALDQEFYGFELNRGDGNKNRVLCFGHGAHRVWLEGPPRTPNRELGVTPWAVTSEYNGPDANTLADYGTLGSETKQVVLVVAKIQFGPDNLDQVTVFVNPSNLTDEKVCVAHVRGEGNFAFDRVSLANFDGFKKYEVDHIRLGTTFASVTSQPFDTLRVAATGTESTNSAQ